MKFNISASSLNLYLKSQIQFYYSVIKKSKPDTEVVEVYGKSGNIVHDTLEKDVKIENFNHEKFFRATWLKEGLDYKRGFNKKPLSEELYYNCVLNGKKYVEEVLSPQGELVAEEEIIIPITKDKNSRYKNINLKGFIDLKLKQIDGVEIFDYKTSSSLPDKRDKNFDRQSIMYFLLHYLKYNILPKKMTFLYLKLLDKDGYCVRVEKTHTLKEVFDFYDYLLKLADEILLKGDDINNYELGDWSDAFNVHIKKCAKIADIRKNGDTIHCVIKNNELIFSNLPEKLKNFIDIKYSYYVQGYEWSDLYKKRLWDGKKRLFNKNKGTLPLGFINNVSKLVDDYNSHFDESYRLNFVDTRDKDVMNFKYNTIFKKSEKTLRDYQEDTKNVLLNKKIGIGFLATGLGKTIVANEIIRELNTRTLFIVNTLELVEQTVEVFKKELGVEIGKLSEGKLEIDKQITVASIQTIYSIMKRKNEDSKKLRIFLFNIALCIWDECHGVGDSLYYKVARSLLINCRYMIGFTGSPFRADESTLEMNALVGYPEVEYDTKFGEDNGYLCVTKCYYIKNNLYDVEGDFPEVYRELIVENEKRNKLIQKLCDKFFGKKILILTRYKDHAVELKKLIPDANIVNSDVKNKDRKENMSFFKNNEGGILIAGIKIAGTGLDIPDLDVLIIASAHKSAVDSVQTIGRVKRISPGKKFGYLFDFYDSGYFQNASYERMKIIKKYGNKVDIIDAEQIKYI